MNDASEWCSHCDVEPRSRRDGLGQACAAYRRKYGRLPGPDVLRRRVERADEARHLQRLIDALAG